MRFMVAKNESPAGHLPIAYGPEPTSDSRRPPSPSRRPSEPRPQAAVVAERKRDERDPYADVPCTD